jgi:hypothetical protein
VSAGRRAGETGRRIGGSAGRRAGETCRRIKLCLFDRSSFLALRSPIVIVLELVVDLSRVLLVSANL